MSHAIVIGGGPAGAAAATRMARAGREVVVVEREHGPADKVCGEFLSHEAGAYLGALGLDLTALGAVPIRALRLYERDRVAEIDLPFTALSLSRRVLDEALLRMAQDAGATIRRGAKVRSLEPHLGGFRVALEDGAALHADAAFLATGKHDLRGRRRPAGLQGDLVALKQHVELRPAQMAELCDHIELVLFEGGYAGLSAVEGGRANLCLLVRRERLAGLGKRWNGVLAALRAESPILDMRLGGATFVARPLGLSSIPYGYVRDSANGVFCLGDQAAVIPSFSGDGLSIALHSAELAAAAFLAGERPEAFQRRLAGDVLRQVLLSTALSHGLVRPVAQRAIHAAARLFPALMANVACRTRVPDAALARAGLPRELSGKFAQGAREMGRG